MFIVICAFFCSDINECVRGLHKCSSDAFCSNTKGSYICTCKPRFTGNGRECKGKRWAFFFHWWVPLKHIHRWFLIVWMLFSSEIKNYEVASVATYTVNIVNQSWNIMPNHESLILVSLKKGIKFKKWMKTSIVLLI